MFHLELLLGAPFDQPNYLLRADTSPPETISSYASKKAILRAKHQTKPLNIVDLPNKE